MSHPYMRGKVKSVFPSIHGRNIQSIWDASVLRSYREGQTLARSFEIFEEVTGKLPTDAELRLRRLPHYNMLNRLNDIRVSDFYQMYMPIVWRRLMGRDERFDGTFVENMQAWNYQLLEKPAIRG